MRKLDVARQVASQRRGVNLFINVRTDVYLKKLVPPERQLEETLTRGTRYARAGADGLFAAGMIASDDIATLCRETPLPINLLSRAGLPSPEALHTLGVRRLSAGSSIAEFLYGAMNTLARSFLERGQLDTQNVAAFTYGEVNALMSSKGQ